MMWISICKNAAGHYNINKIDVLHVRLTELHAAHQNLACYLLTY